MNISILLTTVTLMPIVQTRKDHSSARVRQDTLETESRVLVIKYTLVIVVRSKCMLYIFSVRALHWLHQVLSHSLTAKMKL